MIGRLIRWLVRPIVSEVYQELGINENFNRITEATLLDMEMTRKHQDALHDLSRRIAAIEAVNGIQNPETRSYN